MSSFQRLVGDNTKQLYWGKTLFFASLPFLTASTCRQTCPNSFKLQSESSLMVCILTNSATKQVVTNDGANILFLRYLLESWWLRTISKMLKASYRGARKASPRYRFWSQGRTPVRTTICWMYNKGVSVMMVEPEVEFSAFCWICKGMLPGNG